MDPDFVEGCAEARRPSGIQEVSKASKEEHAGVIVQRSIGTKVGGVSPDGLEVG